MSETSSEYLLRTSREYAIYVCRKRGIPYAADGLKDGQRIALWLLRNRSEKMKTAGLTGAILESLLYNHGEASANDAIGSLAAPYNNNVPLIEGIGNFGSRKEPIEGIGSPRYTSVKRAKAADAFLYNDLDIVSLEWNDDYSNQRPIHFHPLIPLLLLNGVSGIAVGWSTYVFPRSLKSLIEATKAALLDKPIETLVPHFEKYNVKVKPTGQKNQWEISGKVELVDSSTIKITELPPDMKLSSFREFLIDLEDKDEIQSFTDRTTDKIDISVRFKRGTVKDWTVEKAISFFKLRYKMTERIVVLNWDRNSIKQYDSAEEFVKDFAAWRLGFYTKRYEKLLADNSYELIFWCAVKALFIGGFPQRLGKFANKSEVETSVKTIVFDVANFNIDDKHLDRVLNIPTYRWTLEFEKEVDAKIANLESLVKEYTEILESPTRRREIFIQELDELKGKKF